MPSQTEDGTTVRSHISTVNTSETIIPPLSVVHGAIRSDGNVRIEGLYDGPIDTNGDVVVGEHGRVLGDVFARRVSVAGALKGNVAASHVEVLDTGHVWGDLTVDSLTLASGGSFDGRITINRAQASAEEVFGALEPVSAHPPESIAPPEMESAAEPIQSSAPASRPLRWLWTYGLTIPLLGLTIVVAYALYSARSGRARLTSSGSNATAGSRTVQQTRYLAASTVSAAVISPTPTRLPPTSTLPATVEPTLGPTTMATASPTSMVAGGHLVEVGLSSLVTLNPLAAGMDDELSRAVGSLLFDSLLEVDPQTAALSPGLAREWEVSADRLTFVFRLRPGVVWHDGRPLSADDVRYTLMAAANPEGSSAYRFELASLKQVSVLDSETVAVAFAEPDCDALYAVADVPIVPRHLLESEGTATTTFDERPVGTGPFVFGGRGADGAITLNANERYWAGRSQLDSWTYVAVSSVAQLIDNLRSGRAQLAQLPEGLDAATLPGDYRILSYPSGRWHFLALNMSHPLLRDVELRRALALSLDRERLLDVALGGQGTLMDGPWLPNHWAVAGALPPPIEYAPNQARQLLASAGWQDTDGDGLVDQDGERLRLSIVTYPASATREGIALATQQYWRTVGISARVEVVPWGIFLDELFSHTFDVAVLDWPVEAAPDQSWLWATTENDRGGGFNFVSYTDAQVDSLLAEGRTALRCDLAQRAAAYRALNQRLAVDQPYIFLFAAHRRLAVAGNLLGPSPGPYNGVYWNISQWSLGP